MSTGKLPAAGFMPAWERSALQTKMRNAPLGMRRAFLILLYGMNVNRRKLTVLLVAMACAFRAHICPYPARLCATWIIASRLRSTSSSVVAHELTLMRIAVLPCHRVTPHQQVPSR
jgi:hypothetical protein